MARKTTFEGNLFTKKLPIALCYLMATSAFAQNAKEVKAIQRTMNLKEFSTIGNIFKKNTLSVTQLKKEAKKKNIPYEGVSKGRFFQLKGFTPQGKPLYYITHNRDAQGVVGVDRLREPIFGLEGNGIKIHEWDGGGVRASHAEFTENGVSRVTQKDTPTRNSDHSTHVAGTLIGNGTNPSAQGMAPKATLDAYDWTDDETEMTDAATEGALVSNHSYGYSGGFVDGSSYGLNGWLWLGDETEFEFIGYGHYDNTDADWDLISSKAPYYLPVKAAGNPRGDGPEPGETYYVVSEENGQQVAKPTTDARPKNGGEFGYDSIMYGALGKNILTVGAVHKITGGYKKPSDVVPASFSAFGPSDDGRIKPDIAGVGVGLLSAYSTSDTAYQAISGTSMASPNVTGTLALLQEYYKKLGYGTSENPFMKSATLKALALHTANEAGEHDGPDYKFGWGLINGRKAAEVLNTKNKLSLVEELSLKSKTPQTIEVVATGTEPLKVTIVWDDPIVDTQSMPTYTLNNRKSVLVNDLDLRVSDGTTEFLPWTLNPEKPADAAVKADNKVDNIEQIVIPNPEAGKTYTIKISHKGDLYKNQVLSSVKLIKATEQDFSLIATGINKNVATDLAVKSVSVPEPKLYTTTTPITVSIENNGTNDVANAKLKYKLINTDDNTEVTNGEITVSSAPAGKITEVSFDLDLSKSFVNYKIEAEIVADNDDIEVNNKGIAEAFGTIANVTESTESHSFGFEDNIEKNGWSSEKEAYSTTWMKYDSSQLAYEGDSFVVNFPANQPTNSWLFSNPIRVKANKLYRLKFYGRKFQQPNENLQVFFGNDAKPSAMANNISEKITLDLTYNRYFYEFTPTQDGLIYIGFHTKTEGEDKSYAVGVDNFNVRFAEGKPEVDFKASKVNPNSFETINLINESISASTRPAIYKWSITPNTYEWKEGTMETTNSPKVRFTEQGKYTVKLIATNVDGTEELVKNDYITVANTGVTALFSPSSLNSYEGEVVTFTNTSTGNPAPTEYEWTITPTDGVEYVNGSDKNSKNIFVKFNTKGEYEVSLKAKSEFNEDISDTPTKITVASTYNPVRNLKGVFEDTSKNAVLTWEKPFLNPTYVEDFSVTELPAELTVINNNNDEFTWFIDNGTIVSFSLKQFNIDNNDDWLVTPKLRSGADVLDFKVRHTRAERYDVYVVEAPASGKVPSVEEIKAGHKVYSFDATEKSYFFLDRSIDITGKTNKDFYIAFHHRTTESDYSWKLVLDDIKVGYKNSATQSSSSVNNEIETLVEQKLRNKEIITASELNLDEAKARVEPIIKEFGVLNIPHLKGYVVHKDNVEIAKLDDINQLLHNDAITQNGTYTYQVYAVYSDEKLSSPEEVKVVVGTLSVNGAEKQKLVVYEQQPSQFVIKAETGVSTLNVEVYDIAGKLVTKKSNQGNSTVIDLSGQPKGVYIFNIIDNNGVKYSTKVLAK